MSLSHPRSPALAALLLALSLLPACGPSSPPTHSSGSQPSIEEVQPDTKTAPDAETPRSAQTAPIRPDPELTPGDTLDVSLADIQERGYSAKVRNVPISVKREVYAAYGIHNWITGEYEIDHLISLSLGGSNSKKNLWPQSYHTSPWNAHVKDQLELRLLELVRSGQVDLHTAQREMATDWIAAYMKYVSPTPLAGRTGSGGHRGRGRASEASEAPEDEPGESDAPRERTATATAPERAASASGEQVWVNTRSGVIWRPGSEYYGKTREGKYMTADEALAAGYHYAGGSGH